jgi:hypothetical protein
MTNQVKSRVFQHPDSAQTAERINVGIGIVVPGWKILEVIEQSDARRLEKGLLDKIRKERSPNQDNPSTR